MARGRMISKDITLDKRVNDLSNDTSRLAFTWLVAFCDCEGRVHGDPAVVRAILFPRRQDVTIEQTEQYIKEWQDAGLIVWYEAKNDLWIFFPGFVKNQIGLRKDREPKTIIPPQPVIHDGDDLQDTIQQDAGTLPEVIPLKRREENLKEENNNSDPNIPLLYEQNIGGLTPKMRDIIIEWEEDYPLSWIEEAIEISVANEKRNAAYVTGIMKNWKQSGKSKRGEKKPDPASIPVEVWK